MKSVMSGGAWGGRDAEAASGTAAGADARRGRSGGFGLGHAGEVVYFSGAGLTGGLAGCSGAEGAAGLFQT
jgi:hypothetical protein